MLNRFPRLQRIPARIIGLGVRREHIRSPKTSRFVRPAQAAISGD